MSSQVLYPITPVTPTSTTSAPHPAPAAAPPASTRPRRAAALASQAATLAASKAAKRRIAHSSAATASSSTSSSASSTSSIWPKTPQLHHESGGSTGSIGSSGSSSSGASLTSIASLNAASSSKPATSLRPMAALPRTKRARRNEPPADNGLSYMSGNGLAHATANGAAVRNEDHHNPYNLGTHTGGAAAGPSGKASIVSGIDSALNGSYLPRAAYAHDPRQHAPSIPSSSRSRGSAANTSIREMIAGQERDVYVVDSNSPPATSAHGFIPALERGRSTQSIKGKRKAPGTPATNQAINESAAESMYDYGAAAPTHADPRTTVASKRRRKDPYAREQQDAPAVSSDHVRNLYSGHMEAPLEHYLTPVGATPNAAVPSKAQPGTGAPLASYRGGYPAGNVYHKQAADPPRHSTRSGAVGYPPIPPPTQPIDDSEGHYIVREGEFVTAKYQIESLLGQGTFGKVVKCRETRSPRRVAVKIIRAVQKYTDAAQIEIRVLRALRNSDPYNENKCIHLIETFTYENHVCIVSELLGQSVFDFLKENQYHPFPPRHIWSFAQQLLRSVAFLHRLGLVHTDLKPENILLVGDEWDLVPTSNRSNARRRRVLRNTDIRLIDFGSATFNDEYHSQVVSTRHYRAPEIILQMGWSFPCDAWSIGCILVEFYTGDALFQTHENVEHLAMMEAVLGPMPDDFRRKAETYRPNFFSAGRLDFPNSTTNRHSRKFVHSMRPLENLIKSGARYSKHDQRFVHLLKRLLHFDPSQRIRVDQALKHPYFELEEHEIPS